MPIGAVPKCHSFTPTNSEAAKASGVTTRTVQRWRADEPQFAVAVEDARSEMLTEVAGLLAHTTTAAARKLEEIIDGDEERHALSRRKQFWRWQAGTDSTRPWSIG